MGQTQDTGWCEQGGLGNTQQQQEGQVESCSCAVAGQSTTAGREQTGTG